MPEAERAGRGGRMPALLAGASLVGLLGFVLWIAAGPLTTNDLWWHLSHGRAHASEGLRLERDPCLHTAEQPPEPHAWLFDVTAHGVDSWLGPHGLRLAHGLAVLGIAWLALSVFRRSGAGETAALLATCVFLVVSWYRLVQLRPELFSVAAALVLVRLLFTGPAAPSWGRVGVAVGVVWVWANTHALFMLGPLLMLAALVGGAVQAGLARLVLAQPLPPPERRRLQRIAAALALSLLAALANPRGLDQHLTFLVASRQGAIFTVVDEWARFDPLAWTNYSPAVSALAWGLTDLLLLGFVAAAARAGTVFLRAPSAASLRALDPLGLALGAAGLVALLASIRFLWLSVLPLAVLLRLGRGLLVRPAASRLAAAAALALAVAYPVWGGWSAAAGLMPRDPGSWLTQPTTGRRFFEEGIRFLEATGLEGNLYHTHQMGGFLCYRLAPRMRTFLDGSMNYPDEVARDARRIARQRGAWPFETWLDVLERRAVDVFFGVGVPAPRTGRLGEGVYTTTLPERAPGWLLVSRGLRHGIWLRAHPRNRENLARVTAWYAEQGVPFDPAVGLDPDRVIAAAPRWAADHQLVPPRWPDLLRARDAARTEPAPLEAVGLVYALAGAYRTQLANDLQAVRLAPTAKAPRRRLVWALLHLGRAEEAVRQARELLALDPADPRSLRFARAAQRVRQAAGRPFPAPDDRNPVPPDAVIHTLPLLESARPLRQ